MRRILFYLATLLAAAAAASAQERVVDLTHPFDAATIYWPTDVEGFVFERGFAGTTEGGWYYEAHRFRTAEHGGTHLDAPIHFAEGRLHVDEIPVERLVGPAVVVDVSEACAADRDHQVTRAELLAFEARQGRLPDGALLLLRTGFSARWPDRAAYLGTSERGPGAVAQLHFPGLHPDAARWLVSERAVNAVGIDTASIDHGPSQRFEAHRILFERDVPALENLANLESLPPVGATAVALPMKIRGGSGAPLRIVAIVPASE